MKQNGQIKKSHNRIDLANITGNHANDGKV